MDKKEPCPQDPRYDTSRTSRSPPPARPGARAAQDKHYSIRTVDQYIHWIKRFILFHGKRHPCELGRRRWRRF
ncbi:phage integrase N-terminal SAM-like domain-containing protein [Thermochromatium tepidum]|uniref:phage integrase N-terminal SAM-like domain-containing protein n=1 Tax=Thermochromatium tepidum TaxID=1050 RepID=UPI003CCE187B